MCSMQWYSRIAVLAGDDYLTLLYVKNGKFDCIYGKESKAENR